MWKDTVGTEIQNGRYASAARKALAANVKMLFLKIIKLQCLPFEARL